VGVCRRLDPGWWDRLEGDDLELESVVEGDVSDGSQDGRISGKRRIV
jgi:hypothetical protein